MMKQRVTSLGASSSVVVLLLLIRTTMMITIVVPSVVVASSASTAFIADHHHQSTSSSSSAAARRRIGRLYGGVHGEIEVDDAADELTTDSRFSLSGPGLNRRDALRLAGSTCTTTAAVASTWAPAAFAANDDHDDEKLPDVKFGSSWKAVDGLNSLNDQSQIVSFDMSAYKAMKDDQTRTPLFRDAIIKRLGNSPETKTVVDLGTGPYALFALIAAQEGAGKVFAIEANPSAAESARAFIKKSGYDDVITVIEGFSTDVSLPNNDKADLVVAEIIGSIASEEGVYATVRDAASRLVKEPTLASSWIPSRIQTYAAPVSYSLHNLFGPPEFDWTKLNGQPVRFNCRDKGLELLSDPQLVEDITFSKVQQQSGSNRKDFSFVINKDRMDDNENSLFDEFRRDNKSSKEESETLAKQTATSFSGIALWPRLILVDDDSDSIIVNSRHYGDGNHQKSHWQTVLPIASARPIGSLKGGERVDITCNFELPTDVTKPPSYEIDGVLKYN